MVATASARAILRAALADLRRHAGQTALIALMLVAATGALTLAFNVRRGAHEPWLRAFNATHGAHVTFWAPANGETSPDLSVIGQQPGVVAADGPHSELSDIALVVNGQADDVDVQAADDDGVARAVSRPQVTDGAWLSGADGIVIERGYASARHIRVGDTVALRGASGLLSLRVVGLAIEPWRSPYTETNPLVFVRTAALRQLQPDPDAWVASYSVRLAQPEQADAFLNALYAARPFGGSGNVQVGAQVWTDVENGYVSWNDAYAVFLAVFSVMALLACGLIIANLIAGRVLAQFRDIGLFKAIGMTPGQVTLIYLVEHGLLALASAALGAAAAFAVSPYFLRRVDATLHSTATAAFDPTLAAAILLLVLGLVSLCTLLPAWRGGRISALEALTRGFAPPRPRASLLARLALRLRLPLAVTLGVKDVFARRWRAVLSVAALTLTVVTVVFTLSIEATLNYYLSHPALEGEPFDLVLEPRQTTSADLENVLAGRDDVSYYYARDWYDAFPAGGRAARGFIVRALSGDWQAARYDVPEGRMPSAPGEAIAARPLLQQLGLRVGDSVTLQISGAAQPLTVRIVGRYLEDDNDGRLLQVAADTMAPYATDSTFHDVVVKLKRGVNADAARLSLLAATNYGVDITVEHGGKTPPEATEARAVVFGLAAVLLLIGLINLLATTLLSVRERRREFGIAKTLGLTPRELAVSVASGSALLALLASAVGLPLGLLVSDMLFKLVGEHMLSAQPEYYAGPPAGWLALLVVGVVALALLASALPARLAARVAPAEALRAV